MRRTKAARRAAPSTNGKHREPWIDPIFINNLTEATNRLAQNAYTWAARPGIGGGDPRRSVEDEIGVPQLGTRLDPNRLWNLYRRNPLACRLVDVMPNECHGMKFEVRETEDLARETPFEQTFRRLDRNLRNATGAMPSRFDGDEGSPIAEALLRIDKLAGIGCYGVLVFGIEDGRPMREPAAGIEEHNSMPAELGKDGEGKPALVGNSWRGDAAGRYRLVVNLPQTVGSLRPLRGLRAVPEIFAQISRWENNRSSPRFGQPVEYLVNFSGDAATAGWQGPLGYEAVHWSRVLHVADTYHQAPANDLIAAPRMEAAYNQIEGVHLLGSACPEAFYRYGFGGHQFSTHQQLGGDVETDDDSMKAAYQEYINGLQRFLIAKGGAFSPLGVQPADPTSTLDLLITLIAIKTDIPKRKLTGSEQAQLASEQDRNDWQLRVMRRNNMWTIPSLYVRFIDRCWQLGLVAPPETFTVKAEEVNVLTQSEKGALLTQRTTALTTYIGGNGAQLIDEKTWLTKEYGYTEDQADEVLGKAALDAEPAPPEEPAQDSDLPDFTGGGDAQAAD